MLIALTAVAGCSKKSTSGTNSNTNNPTGPGGSTCRTYITSGRDITTGGGSVVTLTYSGTFNTSSMQTTLNTSYVDSAGPAFSYTQVTSYRSVAEFVDEVKVVPPLTLSIGTTASGGTAFSLVNGYDGQRRLTGFTNSSSGGAINTVYTAWDSSGRPTAGSGSATGALTIVYNDAARTATTTITGLGVQVATYDANGNPVTLLQNYGAGSVTTTTTILATGTVCK
ncbi:MAG: hypothetical protein IT184_09050 [Acidobacteria bacterium]|nr:hypothetical protein [Acidobacteriota bacterium]